MGALAAAVVKLSVSFLLIVLAYLVVAGAGPVCSGLALPGGGQVMATPEVTQAARGAQRVARLFSDVRSRSVAGAATVFANAGVPVFPCVPGGKQPLTEHGFHDASTDPLVVGRWWRSWPDANIGVPTGAASGLLVVDVDVHGPVSGFEAFGRAEYAGLVDGWTVMVNTPSGGMHGYYPATPSAVQPCWQAGQAGVDFRGDGGYVIVPPSVLPSDGELVSYRIRAVNTEPTEFVDAQQLRDFLDPRPTLAPHSHPPFGRDADASRLATWLGRQATDRNLKLFWASCRLAEGGVALADALDALVTVAQSDFGEREITRTVYSAYRTVHAVPRSRHNPPEDTSGTAARPLSRPARESIRGL